MESPEQSWNSRWLIRGPHSSDCWPRCLVYLLRVACSWHGHRFLFVCLSFLLRAFAAAGGSSSQLRPFGVLRSCQPPGFSADIPVNSVRICPRSVGVCPRLGGRRGRGTAAAPLFAGHLGAGARAWPVQAKSRKQVDSAEAQTGQWDVRRPMSGRRGGAAK